MDLMNINRIIIGLILGFIGGVIPNKKSNINRLLMGIIFSILGTKILIGDFDYGYQWSRYDIIFVLYTSLLGIIGAYISSSFLKISY